MRTTVDEAKEQYMKLADLRARGVRLQWAGTAIGVLCMLAAVLCCNVLSLLFLFLVGCAAKSKAIADEAIRMIDNELPKLSEIISKDL